MADFLTALRAELAKPAYAGKTDAEVLAILDGPGTPIVETRTVVPSHEVYEAMVPGDWTALSTAEKQRIQTLLGMGDVDLSGANTVESLKTAFGAGTVTRANLLTLKTRTTPRTLAVELFGFPVGLADIATARLA